MGPFMQPVVWRPGVCYVVQKKYQTQEDLNDKGFLSKRQPSGKASGRKAHARLGEQGAPLVSESLIVRCNGPPVLLKRWC